jgi:hypothetical protein
MAIQIDRILQRLEPTTDLHGDLGEDLDQATRDSLKRLL